MALLTALIAFAVTMMILSTVVTAIVQVLHDFRRARQRHLVRFVEAMFDEVYSDELGGKIKRYSKNRPPKSIDEVKKSWFALLMDVVMEFCVCVIACISAMQSPLARGVVWIVVLVLFVLFVLPLLLASYQLDLHAVIAGIALFFVYQFDRRSIENQMNPVKIDVADDQIPDNEPPEDKRARLRAEFVRHMTTIVGTSEKRNKAAELSVIDFASRLGRSEIGRRIYDKGEMAARALITDLARRFDLIGKGASASFGELSRRWSVRVAFVLAIAVNVDAVTLIKTYIEKPELAAKVEALGVTSAGNLQEELKALTKKREDTTTPEAEKAQLDKQIQLLQEKIKVQLESLTEIGVPIGWHMYPFCLVDKPEEAEPRCKPVIHAEKGREFAPLIAQAETAAAELKKKLTTDEAGAFLGAKKKHAETTAALAKASKNLETAKKKLDQAESEVEAWKKNEKAAKEAGQPAAPADQLKRLEAAVMVLKKEHSDAEKAKQTATKASEEAAKALTEAQKELDSAEKTVAGAKEAFASMSYDRAIDDAKKVVKQATDEKIQVKDVNHPHDGELSDFFCWWTVFDSAKGNCVKTTDAIEIWFGDRVNTGGGTFTAWIVGAFLGGALIGLGGPFWFDTFRRLSALASLVRSIRQPSAKTADPAQDAPKPEPETAHAPQHVAEAFVSAAKAYVASTADGPSVPPPTFTPPQPTPPASPGDSPQPGDPPQPPDPSQPGGSGTS